MSLKYYELYHTKADRYIPRQKLVAYAREHGCKAAARAFDCSRNTVPKWLRRYCRTVPSSLNELSRRPHHCPHKTPAVLERRIVRLRQQTGCGAERLKAEFQLPCGLSTIRRILRQSKLLRRPKRKPHTKRSLQIVKRHRSDFPSLRSRGKQNL